MEVNFCNPSPIRMLSQLAREREGTMRRATGLYFSKSVLFFALQIEKLRPKWGEGLCPKSHK